MDDEVRPKPDLTLASLRKQDLSTLSVADLETRIESLRSEIARCEQAIGARNDTRAAAESIFKL